MSQEINKDLKDIIRDDNYIKSQTDFTKCKIMIDIIYRIYDERNIKLIFIFDQINNVMNRKNIKPYESDPTLANQLKFIEWLKEQRYSMILSASAENDIEELNKIEYSQILPPLTIFNLLEFKSHSFIILSFPAVASILESKFKDKVRISS